MQREPENICPVRLYMKTYRLSRSSFVGCVDVCRAAMSKTYLYSDKCESLNQVSVNREMKDAGEDNGFGRKGRLRWPVG